MSSYDVGDMFWGKSQSYPWWPCVIMTNNNNEIKRTRKKTGTQYHVQFIGQVYDACWITNNFLIKYDGTEKFEAYVEQQLRSSLPPQHKLMFEMKMTGQIQTMWIQACQDAEKIYHLPKSERILQLPKLDESFPIIKKPKSKKHLSKAAYKLSETSSLSDNISVDTKSIDVEDQTTKESLLNMEIEEICRKAFLIEETENRVKNSTESISHSEIENMLNEQWNVLDVETKLLYLNGDISNTSKSRVSGRKIKVPSRLRRLNELEDLKKATLKKRTSDSTTDKKKSISQDASLSCSVQNTDDSKLLNSESSSPSLQINCNNKETFDSTFLQSLQIKNSSMEIFKLIVSKDFPIIPELCNQCLQPFKPNEKLKSCQGDCQASYHVMCALNHKLFRVDDNDKCVNCVPKDANCCICKNSKYMKKLLLVKCSKPECPLYFHATCLNFLTFVDSASEKKDIIVCPNHSCLTCSREDINHPCNSSGSLVTCIRCPISYHSDMLCIPAGCRVLSENKIICHRHFESTLPSFSNSLTRCFVCFTEKATLRCCRCRAAFHPNCVGLGTYADLLKDFVCSTCKLEKPLFHGQIVWVETDNLWTPCEIVIPTRILDKSVQYANKSLVVRTVEHGRFICIDQCELVTFVIGESVLRDIMTTNKKVVECAKKMNIVYLNWRKRMRPFSSEKCPIICPDELVKLSTVCYNNSTIATNCKYEYIKKNVYDINVKNIIPFQVFTSCSCSIKNELCNGSYCINYKNQVECHKNNCKSISCTNRRFLTGFQIKPYVSLNESTNQMCVKVLESLEKGAIIGELTGNVISTETAYKLINESNNFNSISYTFQLKEDMFLNCEKQSNEWRHLSHSCNPNAELVCWNVAGEYRLGISLLKNISNEEITINFKKSGVIMKYEFICNCRSINCLKSFGPTSLFANKTNVIIPLCCVNNKRIDVLCISHESIQSNTEITDSHSNLSICPTKSQQIPLIDDSVVDRISCHRCGYRGELIICNKANCNKRYHLQCVEMSTAPKGLWYCPKHFCIECSQPATTFCNNCSTSHCKTHSVLQKRHNCRKFIKSAKITPIIIQNNISECELITNIPNFVSTKLVSDYESMKEEHQDETNKSEETVTKTNLPLKFEQVSKTNNSKQSDILSESDKLPIKSDEIVDSNVIIKSDQKRIYTSKRTGSVVKPEIIIMKTGQNKMVNARKSERFINTSIIIKKPDTKKSILSNKPIQISELNKNDLYSACDLVPILVRNNEPEPVNINNVTCSNPVKLNVKRSVDVTNDNSEEIKKPKLERNLSVEETMMIPESVEDLSDIRCQVVPLGIEDMENLIISPIILDD